MAKKSANSDKATLDILGIIKDSAHEASNQDIREYIGTGHYTLNASLSGSIFGGIPAGRVVMLGGESGTGKTYLCMDCMREAQKMGYTVLVFDTEGSYEREMLYRFGIDMSNLVLTKTNMMDEITSSIIKLTDNINGKLEEAKKKGVEVELPRVMIIIDSIGAVSTDKEIEQAKEGDMSKLNMTKAKQLRQMSKIVTDRLSNLSIPMIVTNHTYASQGTYVPTRVFSGGEGLIYLSSIALMLYKSNLDGKDKESDTLKQELEGLGLKAGKSGSLITCKTEKNRFAKPISSNFQISFYTKNNPYIGLETFLSWDTVGIEKGNILEERDYKKLTPAEAEKARAFDVVDKETGEVKVKYFMPKETARGYVVKHLGMSVPTNKIHSSAVFTPEVLKELDEKVIKPIYTLPSKAEFEQSGDIDLSDEGITFDDIF